MGDDRETNLLDSPNTHDPQPHPNAAAKHAAQELFEQVHNELDDKFDEEEGASIPMTVLNIVCNILGGAVLVLPTAFMHSGIIWGILLTTFAGVMSMLSIAMLTLCAHKLQKFTYKEILAIAASEKVGKCFEGVLFLYTYGVLVEYARIIADSMPEAVENLFHARGVWVESWFWLLIAFFLFFGLSSMKALSELTWSSVVGFLTIFYVIILVAVRYFNGAQRLPGESGITAPDVDVGSFRASILQSIPVMTMSFSCHYNIPAYYRELKHRSVPRMRKSILIVVPFIFTLYIITGVLGYLSFGDSQLSKIHGDVMTGYPKDDVAVNIGRLGLFFHFVCVFPIIAIGCRRCLNTIIFGSADQSRKIYIIEAFCLVSSSCTIAFFVSGISIVIEIIGSLFGMWISFVLPAVMYLRIYREDFRLKEEVQADSHLHFSATGEAIYDDDTKKNTTGVENGEDVKKNESFIEIVQDDGTIMKIKKGTAAKEEENEEEEHHLSRKDAPVSLATLAPLQIPWLYKMSYAFAIIGALLSIASFSLTMEKIIKGDE